jgi:maleate isomerase
MIVTSNDQTLSYEARSMLGVPGIALYESRILSARARDAELSVTNLTKLEEGLVEAARQINSFRAPDVVAIGCTSGAMVIGPDALTDHIRSIYPKALVTDPLTAIGCGLRAMNANRICFISPYPRQVAEMMIGHLHRLGYDVQVTGRFQNQSGNPSADAAFISPASIVEAILRLGESKSIDTVVVACTQMRAAGILQHVERELDKPVLSSNQALCWHALRLAGYRETHDRWGRLFLEQLLDY